MAANENPVGAMGQLPELAQLYRTMHDELQSLIDGAQAGDDVDVPTQNVALISQLGGILHGQIAEDFKSIVNADALRGQTEIKQCRQVTQMITDFSNSQFAFLEKQMKMLADENTALKARANEAETARDKANELVAALESMGIDPRELFKGPCAHIPADAPEIVKNKEYLAALKYFEAQLALGVLDIDRLRPSLNLIYFCTTQDCSYFASAKLIKLPRGGTSIRLPGNGDGGGDYTCVSCSANIEEVKAIALKNCTFQYRSDNKTHLVDASDSTKVLWYSRGGRVCREYNISNDVSLNEANTIT